MKLKHFLLNTILLFIFGVLTVASANFPSVDEMPVVGGDTGTWGQKLLNMHNKTVDTIRVTLTDNGTLKDGIVRENALNLTNVTLLDFINDASFLTTIATANIQDNAVKQSKLNLTDITLGDFNNDRADLWVLSNDTNAWNTLYNAKTDRFTIQNLTAQPLYNKGNLSSDINLFSSSFWASINNTGVVYATNSSFVVVNEQNPTNATIELGKIGGYSTLWNINNQTTRENSYFRVENGSSLSFSNFRNENVTISNSTIEFGSIGGYASAWKVENQTARETAYFRSENITSTANATHVACWKTATTLGNCANATGNDGTCNCI